MWSYLRVFERTRAAAFCVRWSLSSRVFEIPYKSAFPLSRQEVIRAWTSIEAVSSDKIFLMELMFRIWKYADWQIFLIWSAIVIFSSRKIPKFRAECADWIFALAIWIWLSWILECILGVVNIISSVFSSFNFSLFAVIHDLISATHFSILERMVNSSCGEFMS